MLSEEESTEHYDVQHELKIKYKRLMMKTQRYRPHHPCQLIPVQQSPKIVVGPLGDNRLKRELHRYDVWLICKDKKREFDWLSNPEMQRSHLCHNGPWCINPKHIVIEDFVINGHERTECVQINFIAVQGNYHVCYTFRWI